MKRYGKCREESAKTIIDKPIFLDKTGLKSCYKNLRDSVLIQCEGFFSAKLTKKFVAY